MQLHVLSRRILHALLLMHVAHAAHAAEPMTAPNPLSQGGSSVQPQRAPTGTTAEAEEARTELVVLLANESNLRDGVFGPVTYGLRGRHQAENGWSLEAGYVRLHEPHSPAVDSVVDEAELTVSAPQLNLGQQPFTVSATAWQNRMIDMYTSVAGLELTWAGKLAVNAALYAGEATRENLAGRFLGAQLGASMAFGRVDVAIGEMAGMIRLPRDGSAWGTGRYFKSALELAVNVAVGNQLPVAVTAAVQHRYFDFGNAGPVSETLDGWIFVLGMEVNVAEWLTRTR